MVVAGGCLFNLALGIALGGLLLIVLTAFSARIAGLYLSKGGP